MTATLFDHMETSELQEQLRSHPESEMRRRSAEELGLAQADSQVIYTLAIGLQDPDAGVRDACSLALLREPEQNTAEKARAIAPLIFSSDIEVRNLAGDILLQLGSASIEPLAPYLKHPDFDVRKFAADIIGLVGNQSHAGLVEPLLDDLDVNVRVAGVEALGNMHAEHSLDLLFQYYDTEEELRAPIIDAVGKIGNHECQVFLVEKLRSEPDLFLQTAAIDALAVCGQDTDISLKLLDLLPESPEELQGIILKTIIAIAYRQGMIISLDPHMRNLAYSAMLDNDPDIRAAGLLALGQSYDIADVPSLIHEIKNKVADTQQQILYTLLAGSTTKANAAFFRMLLSEDMPTDIATDLLGFLPAFWPSAIAENAVAVSTMLLSTYLTSSGGAAGAIIELMLNIDRPAALDALAEALETEDEEKMTEALDMIANLGLAELKTKVQSLAESKSEIAHRAAAVMQELA
jgi:HEAT repeat protein